MLLQQLREIYKAERSVILEKTSCVRILPGEIVSGAFLLEAEFVRKSIPSNSRADELGNDQGYV